MQLLQQRNKLHTGTCTAALAPSSAATSQPNTRVPRFPMATPVASPQAGGLHRSSSRSRTPAAHVLRSPTQHHTTAFSPHTGRPSLTSHAVVTVHHRRASQAVTAALMPVGSLAATPASRRASNTGRPFRTVCRDTPFVGGETASAGQLGVEQQQQQQHYEALSAAAAQLEHLAHLPAAERVSWETAAAAAEPNGPATWFGSSNSGLAAAAVYDADACNPNYNKAGLNGLTLGGTTGLATGSFTVSSQMPVRYTVQEVSGLLDPRNKALLRGVVPGSFPFALGPEPQVTAGLRRLVVIDDNVERIYGQQLRQYFAAHGVEHRLLVLPTCEANKDFGLVEAIAQAMEDFKINRRQDPIIAIGGGVCLDVAGLAANLYRRHTGIIKVPTTVMAVVDASIGIKTAVNFHSKKNKLGTYCPPLGVFYDTSFLVTLEQRHISNGAAEVLKMACIKDRELFELLEVHAEDLVDSKFQCPAAATVIRRSIQGMLEELEYNLWEAVLVRLVDYGHTVSPELEMAALRSPGMLLHGEAVAIDMALSTELAYGRGLLTQQQRARVLGLMLALRLPLWHQACSLQLFMKGLEDMTRARDGLQRVPLMNGIGGAIFANDITTAEMAAATSRLLQFAAANGDTAAVEAVRGGAGASLPAAAAARNNIVPLPSAASLKGNSEPAAAGATV